MFQKKNINELIARYELNFEDYPSSALQNRSTQDIKVAASNQSAADKSINAFSQISYFGQAHSHQNWAIIRQNEQIIR
ncbi:MAG: hypothetical protein FWE48_03910, partial [Coriobacteriia bacterium]|nr:hypothetical protein [Coriobacteriia bacterium]